MVDQSGSSLSQELSQLFDLRKSKVRDQKKLNQEATEAHKDIRLLIHMFRDGIPDVTVTISENESLVWNSRVQQLLYCVDGRSHILEGTSCEIRVRLRPYLPEMVKKAKEMMT